MTPLSLDASIANSFATEAAGTAASGAPFYNSAGIYFGNADIGAASLTNRPLVAPNNPVTADATAATARNGSAQAVTGQPGVLAASGIGIGTILLVVAVVGGLIWYVNK